MGIILSIVIGAVAGWLAGLIMKDHGFGFWINLLVGIVGGFIGGEVLSWLNISWGGLFGQLATAVVGAVILLWIVSLFRKGKK
ncbi:MAG: GlsB/YeaQ/YmgE family stress response membrane protein [Bacteroidales bacterium]|nr:GlsB/YeaQ/YmgE family stress response membrane protein [Bacteroidales bacterium]MDD4670259.1 GlsB/YeaQ/YmgE family stress response membrane protein [Bacteroidales bacterium]